MRFLSDKPMPHVCAFIAGAFGVGIWLGCLIYPAYPLLYVLALASVGLCLFCIRYPRLFEIALVFCTIIMGLLRISAYRAVPANHIARIVNRYAHQTYAVKGDIISPPSRRLYTTAYVMRCKEIQPYPPAAGHHKQRRHCTGEVTLAIRGTYALEYADEVIAIGSIHRPYLPRTSAIRQKRRFHPRPRMILNVTDARNCIRQTPAPRFSLMHICIHIRDTVIRILAVGVSRPAAAVLAAMIIGDKTNIPLALNDAMMKTGTIHILVVSGFNVGLVAGVIMLILKVARVRRAYWAWYAGPALIMYCMASGASTPVVRATCMALVLLFAYTFQRETDIYNALGLAALALFAYDPFQIFDVSFQLSFASVWSIVFFYPLLKKLFRIEAITAKLVRFIVEGAAVSLSAWLGTSGLIYFYFRLCSPIAVVANIFVVPLASFITLSGFVTIGIYYAWPPASNYYAACNELAVRALIFINVVLSKIPGGYFDGR